MQYRAEFPTEFPEKSGKSIGNSALYCIFLDPGNFSILPVYKFHKGKQDTMHKGISYCSCNEQLSLIPVVSLQSLDSRYWTVFYH